MGMIRYSTYAMSAAASCLVLAACSGGVQGPSRASLIDDGQAQSLNYQHPSIEPQTARVPLTQPTARIYYRGNADTDTSRAPGTTWTGRQDSRADAAINPAPYALQAAPRPLTAPQPMPAHRSFSSRPQLRHSIPPHYDSRSNVPLRRFAAMPRHKAHAPHVRQNEGACLSSGIVQSTSFVRPRSSIGGGQCYIARPFSMHAAAAGRVRFEPFATVRCQMIPSIETWVREILRPAARRILGTDVVKLRIAGSYGCRTRNHRAGARLSEHGKANALDISQFHLANGEVITVKTGWHGSRKERQFLRYVHRGACEHFSTVLGPNADRHHRDHFHFDLAQHGRSGTYRVCK